MAASVDLTSGGTGGPADLDALVKALDRFTAALQGVAKQAGLGGGDEAAPAGETPGAPAGGMGGISQMIANYLPKQLEGLANISQGIGAFGEKLLTLAATMQMANKSAGGLPGVAEKLAGLVGSFGGGLRTAATAIMRYVYPAGIAAAIVFLAKKLPVIGETMEVGAQGFLRPLRSLGASISGSLVPMRQFQERALVVASTFENLGKAQYAYSEAIGNSSNQVASVVKGGLSRVTAVLTNPLQEIPQLVAELRPFVEAFNPAVLQEYDQAMRSVMAVIGEALVPVIRVASALLREFAGYLRPIMRQLEPVITEVARAVGGFLKEILPLLPEFINSLLPVLRQYMEGLKEQLAAGAEYAKGTWTLSDKLWYAADKLTLGMFDIGPKFAGRMAQGLPAGVQKENISAYGAAQAPTFKGTAELGKDLMQAAFIARPGELVDDSAKQTADNTARAADLLEQLVDVNKGAQTYDARVAEGGIIGGAQAAVGQVAEGVYNFGVGFTNLLSGNFTSEGMIDI